MALTEQQLRTPTTEAIQTQGHISRGWSLSLLGSWIATLVLAHILEPAPTGSEPVWAHVVSIGMLAAVIATFHGLARRTSWAASASVMTSLGFVVGVFLCPATGHHAFGLWWIGQFAAALGLVSLSTVAAVRHWRTR